VKLLRVLETRAFFRVGGTRRRTVDMRLVAATNRDLAEAIRGKQFREDLYYRINTITVSLPPLRERRGDIPLLVEQFLEANAAYGAKTVSRAALACLERYDWPGNVRELQHAIQRAVILSTGQEIEPDDLPAEMRAGGGAPAAMPPSGSLDDMERQHIIATLHQVGGHRAKAAALLGIDPKTLYRKILTYGISPDVPKS
jgi:DNA-binding NtrC family response regulator